MKPTPSRLGDKHTECTGNGEGGCVLLDVVESGDMTDVEIAIGFEGDSGGDLENRGAAHLPDHGAAENGVIEGGGVGGRDSFRCGGGFRGRGSGMFVEEMQEIAGKRVDDKRIGGDEALGANVVAFRGLRHRCPQQRHTVQYLPFEGFFDEREAVSDVLICFPQSVTRSTHTIQH